MFSKFQLVSVSSSLFWFNAGLKFAYVMDTYGEAYALPTSGLIIVTFQLRAREWGVFPTPVKSHDFITYFCASFLSPSLSFSFVASWPSHGLLVRILEQGYTDQMGASTAISHV